MRFMIRFALVADMSTPLRVRTLPVIFKTKEEAMRHAVNWEGWRRIQIRYGGKDEPPSCLMLIEPVSDRQPVTLVPGLMGCPNTADSVDQRLKDAYYGDCNYL